VCRELTKLHEEVFRGSAEEAARRFSSEVKGEVTLVVRGGAAEDAAGIEEALGMAQSYVAEGASASRAAARVARETGRRKAEVYDRLVGGAGDTSDRL
jgi:16S rRNA (cytidine1402-2'-O)-methyltransferase